MGIVILLIAAIFMGTGMTLVTNAIAEQRTANASVVVIPPMPQHVPTAEYWQDSLEWATYWHEAFEEYEDEFTALFNSYETKWSKNNRLMIRQGNSGSYRFVAKA